MVIHERDTHTHKMDHTCFEIIRRPTLTRLRRNLDVKFGSVLPKNCLALLFFDDIAYFVWLGFALHCVACLAWRGFCFVLPFDVFCSL